MYDRYCMQCSRYQRRTRAGGQILANTNPSAKVKPCSSLRMRASACVLLSLAVLSTAAPSYPPDVAKNMNQSADPCNDFYGEWALSKMAELSRCSFGWLAMLHPKVLVQFAADCDTSVWLSGSFRVRLWCLDCKHAVGTHGRRHLQVHFHDLQQQRGHPRKRHPKQQLPFGSPVSFGSFLFYWRCFM